MDLLIYVSRLMLARQERGRREYDDGLSPELKTGGLA